MVSKSIRTSGAAYAAPYCELTAEDYRIIAKRPGAVSMTRDDERDARRMTVFTRLARFANALARVAETEFGALEAREWIARAECGSL